MNQRSVLVVEDDAAIRRGLADALRFEGYQVHQAATGDEGLRLALQLDYDLLLLDLVLPQRDGLDILAQLRAARPTVPVIVLTARGDENDRVRGLRLGADDYLVKPFSVRELLARVEAVLRRTPGRPLDVVEVRLASGVVHLPRREVRFHDGRRVELSQREVELLRYLSMHAGRPVSRDELLANVWRISPQGVSTRTIDMHVARLRDKLESADGEQVIQTVRGQGYMFAAAPVSSSPSAGENGPEAHGH
jgi:DNA-binding response OmpR family regulator